MKTIKRGFNLGGSRYQYDQNLKAADGWKQYDTDQDAWYFGVWVNLEAKQVFTFAEGDTTLVTFTTEDEVRYELAQMAEFYGPPPPAFRVIDFEDGTRTEYYDERPSL